MQSYLLWFMGQYLSQNNTYFSIVLCIQLLNCTAIWHGHSHLLAKWELWNFTGFWLVWICQDKPDRITKSCRRNKEMLWVCVCFRTICLVVVNLYSKVKKNTYTRYVWYSATQITYNSAEIVASMIIDDRIVTVLLKRCGLVLCRII